MDDKYWSMLKRVAVTIAMALVSSIIGLLINSLVSSLTDTFPDLASGNSATMSSYERQISQHIVNPDAISDRFERVGGIEEIKKDLQINIMLPLKHPHIFFSENSVLRPSRGILLYGPPGTGKTMLARAIAAEAAVPFINLSLSSLENKYFGETSKLLQATFSLARRIQPCIVFFDEIDGLLKQRSDYDQSSVYGFKTELLSQMDGMHSKDDDSIFIIGTTNHLESLDPALRRRMPKVYRVQLPAEHERLEILKLKLDGQYVAAPTLLKVATMTKGASGSDLSELVRRASSFRMQDQCRMADFHDQLQMAKCVEDVRLLPLNSTHFQRALSDMNFSGIFEEEEEEAPPTDAMRLGESHQKDEEKKRIPTCKTQSTL